MMSRFWTKVRVLFVLVTIVATTCLMLSTVFINRKIYTGVYEENMEGLGLTMDTLRQPSVSDPNPNLKSKFKADDNFTSKIKIIAKAIFEAKKHVRGSKTSDYLKEAIGTMDDLLERIGIDKASVYSRTTHEPKSVCPEAYKGTTFGYPFFYKGFEMTNCSYGIPTYNLVTILKPFHDNESYSDTEKFVSSVYQVHQNFTLIISVNSEQKARVLRKAFPKLTVQTHNSESNGKIWNNLVKQAKTPYVLIARNVEILTNDSRLDRLVREYESLNVAAVSGASRDSNGQWKKGCFQSVYRNFSLRYLEGYDESLHECIFCDYTEGPFLVNREYLEKNSFSDLDEYRGLFEDWFLKIVKEKKETVVCPDSMFHVGKRQNYETETDGHQWEAMMKKWDIYRLRPPRGGATLTRACSAGKQADTLCGVQGNAEAVKTIMKVCEDNGMFCELQEGTALGAVKLEKTLPWERDADITFLTANYTQFKKLGDVFGKYGIKLGDGGGIWCCVDNRDAGGKFMLRYKGWNIEMYGQHIMDSELMTLSGMNKTKVLLDGQWVNVPRNPGLFVRNRYGREIYQHAQHWMTTGGSSGWINYKTNVFKPCSSPGEHHCLDRYNADGNLPFVEVLP